MSLEITKIKNRILMLGKKIKTDIDKTIVEASNKYNLDLTKTVLAYSSNLIKNKIDQIINEEAAKFNYITMIVDYGVCDSEINIIVNTINSLKEELRNELPEGEDISNFKVLVNEKMKLIILEFPSLWGTEIVDDFRKSLLETLREKDIVKI
ncbi:MAG: hypothetical protein ACTSRG_17995 [Candidatus Helarchaeota archaeon]